MTESQLWLGELATTPAEAVRSASVLEATAPKVGNVYPGQSFDDLTHSDFMVASEIASHHLTASQQPMSKRMLDAVQETVRTLGGNVNLGILLLLGPLVAADEMSEGNFGRATIASFLDSLDQHDGENIYAMIRAASPGGLGHSESNDVHDTNGPINIIEAMAQAADRDRVARQYATSFLDLIDNVVPVVRSSIESSDDLLVGISRAHLRLLAKEPDSLIARKCGNEFAVQVRDRAAEININDREEIDAFDRWLRSDGHKRNPGTTADLIAASLYWILRGNDE